jgi:hypothetical protein
MLIKGAAAVSDTRSRQRGLRRVSRVRVEVLRDTL